MDNPYLGAFLEILPEDEETGQRDKEERFKLCRRYAWSVPTEEAVQLLAELSPIVELGAGNGYWASLVRAAGGDVVAYDSQPPGIAEWNNYHLQDGCWTTVETGGLEMVGEHSDRTLLLCWPPYSKKEEPSTLAEAKEHFRTCMGYQALRRYRGQRVVYIGEWRCCTAGWAFHELLERRWDEVKRVALPCWPGVTDRLTVYERARVPARTRRRLRTRALPLPTPAPTPALWVPGKHGSASASSSTPEARALTGVSVS